MVIVYVISISVTTCEQVLLSLIYGKGILAARDLLILPAAAEGRGRAGV